MNSKKIKSGIILTSLFILTACGGSSNNEGDGGSETGNSSIAEGSSQTTTGGSISTGSTGSTTSGQYDLAKYLFSWDLHSHGSQVIRPYAMYLRDSDTGEYVDNQPKQNEIREEALAEAQQALIELKQERISDPNPIIDYPLFI